MYYVILYIFVFFFKQKTAYEMRISDWSSDVCSSDLLDGFKEVNDRFGHGAGDLLLTQVARRLRDALGDDDLLARMGGDEFMVVVRGMVPDQVAPLADRLIAAISRHEIGRASCRDRVWQYV